MARKLDRNVLVWGIFTILIATLDVSTKVIDNKYYKQYSNKWNTGGPPLTQKSLTRFPLPWFLAYVRASRGFSRLVGDPLQSH